MNHFPGPDESLGHRAMQYEKATGLQAGAFLDLCVEHSIDYSHTTWGTRRHCHNYYKRWRHDSTQASLISWHAGYGRNSHKSNHGRRRPSSNSVHGKLESGLAQTQEH